METKTTEKFGLGFQAKFTTGISLWGIADTSVFAEIKTMFNWGTSEATSETTAYSAAPAGQVSIKPGADGQLGNCSIIEVFVEKVKASGTLGVAAVIPADDVIMVKVQDHR